MRTAALLGLSWTLAAALVSTPAATQPSARFADAPSAGRAEHWARAAARRLYARALEYERRGDAPRALVAYTDALAMDAAFGPAWLGLGRLRAAMHDDREAERVLSEATRIEDVAAEALFERALLRRRMGQSRDAFADLERSIAVRPTLEHVRLLASWYVELRAWPAALATWRRFAASLEADADEPLRKEAALQLSALGLLAAETDPVLSGSTSTIWERRSLARIARRRAP